MSSRSTSRSGDRRLSPATCLTTSPRPSWNVRSASFRRAPCFCCKRKSHTAWWPNRDRATMATLHFDLSVCDVYNPREGGATVSLITEDLAVFPTSLATFIETQQITIWYSVPSALMLLLLHGRLTAGKLQSLRIILFAGEVFPMKYLRQLAEVSQNTELYNLYGPTETNVCTYYKVE